MRTLRRFTGSEDRRLIDMWTRGVTAKEIAKTLRRSHGVITGRIDYLRRIKKVEIPMHLHANTSNRWTEEDEHTVRSMWTSDFTVRDISIRIGRSTNTIYQRARVLGLGRKPYRVANPIQRRLEAIDLLLKNGFTQADIQLLLNVSRQRVSQLKFKAERMVRIGATVKK